MKAAETVEDPSVKLSFADDIATITLDRPGGNRINFAMRRTMLEAVRAVADSDARTLIVSAQGDDFSLGGDAAEWVGIPSHDLEPLVAVYATALEELQDLPIPTVAVVQGRCRGGGCELALSCDFICAAQSADFGFPESQLGIITLQGGVLQLAERIGRTRALEMTTLSRPVSATRMYEWNLVNWLSVTACLPQRASGWDASSPTPRLSLSRRPKRCLNSHTSAVPGPREASSTQSRCPCSILRRFNPHLTRPVGESTRPVPAEHGTAQTPSSDRGLGSLFGSRSSRTDQSWSPSAGRYRDSALGVPDA
ncbi:hypothetical protein B7R22_14810 [Subtercola boreus]|uniref:Enoyl-CoA hydratase n=1 Tax=Subtercola boreus TaxID=120213 RepID=A0A3E0VSD1_9MICO|nr:hypothetical protein B7R22_14810 [Subtercola boreus]